MLFSYLSQFRATKVQASLRHRTDSPEPSLLLIKIIENCIGTYMCKEVFAHTMYEISTKIHALAHIDNIRRNFIPLMTACHTKG